MRRASKCSRRGPFRFSLVVMQSRGGKVMTVTLTFEDSGGGTRYTARVRRWPVGEEEANETMGLELR
jgi:uncharacterized protein YndB with AHSA1/START domain